MLLVVIYSYTTMEGFMNVKERMFAACCEPFDMIHCVFRHI